MTRRLTRPGSYRDAAAHRSRGGRDHTTLSAVKFATTHRLLAQLHELRPAKPKPWQALGSEIHARLEVRRSRRGAAARKTGAEWGRILLKACFLMLFDSPCGVACVAEGRLQSGSKVARSSMGCGASARQVTPAEFDHLAPQWQPIASVSTPGSDLPWIPSPEVMDPGGLLQQGHDALRP